MAILNLQHTRIDFWKHPQFTRQGMWWITLLFGFLGFHHLYLRSPQTAILCAVVNCLTLGFWWAFDLTQLSTYDNEHLNKYGLDSPFGALGLAQGMWGDKEELRAVPTQEEGGPPSPTYALAYYLLLPFFTAGAVGLAGDIPNAVSRLTFFFPLFALFIPALIYDLYRAVGTPGVLFERGHSRFMPFTWLGFDVDGHSPNLQKPGTVDPSCPAPSFVESIVGLFKNFMLMGMPFLRVVAPGIAASIESGMAAAESAASKAKMGVEVAQKAATVAATAPAAMSQVVTSLADPTRLIQEKLGSELAAQVQAQPLAGTLAAAALQRGGALAAEASPVLPFFIAGTILVLLLGGLVVTGYRRLSDEPPSVRSAELDDTPPNPRRIREDMAS